MRVSQLARKLNVLPADVLAALPDGAVQTEGAYNARLTPAQVEEVVRFFRPGQWEKFMNDLQTWQEENEAPHQKEQTTTFESDVQTDLPVSSEPVVAAMSQDLPSGQQETHFQEVEVIRAPKVELPGLRVVGKIEIPEKKKSEIHAKQEAKVHSPDQQNPNRRVQAKSKDKLHAKRNPIAIARERAKREAELQRKKEAEREKQRKTERYLKKIAERKARMEQQSHAKTKRQKIDPAEQIHLAEVSAQHLTLWQRFKKWLFRE